MAINFVRRYCVLFLLLCVAGAVPAVAFAQDNGTAGPPTVLVIQREMLKPGKAGASHTKTEGAFIAAAKAGKAPFRYFAMVSMSGLPRALFFSGYTSLASWEAENKSMDANVSLSAALDKANQVDGELLTEQAQSVWTLRKDLSVKMGDLLGKRYMEIRQFTVKPGHTHDFEEMAKMYADAYKQTPAANWTTFEEVFGTNSNAFLVMTPLKDLSEADAELVPNPTFEAALGKDGMKKLSELEAASIEAEQVSLFRIDPTMSYPPEPWLKAEPDFWKPKMPPVAKKPAQ